MEDYNENKQSYFQDMIILQDIFPEEIWIQILKRLPDFTDFQNTCAASRYFHNLLQPIRTQILFPEIVKHLLDLICLSKDAYPQLLKCRQVCSAWKKGVDTAFQTILNESLPNGGDCVCRTHPNFKIYQFRQFHLRHDFSDEKSITKFREKFHDSIAPKGFNPFSGKLVGIYNGHGKRFTEQNSKVLELLSMHGHNILYCKVGLSFRVTDVELLISFFRTALRLMPNVKSLILSSYFMEYVDNTILNSLNDVLLKKPLPELAKIESVEVADNSCNPLFTQLIMQNTQITKLILHRSDSETFSTIFALPFVNLEELCFLRVNSVDGFINLQKLQVKWPLKKLTLGYLHPNIRPLDIFKLINFQWAETLTSLELGLSKAPSRGSALVLPHLESLVISMRQYTSMDFILPMQRSLISLCVRIQNGVDYTESLETDSTIQFFLHRHNLMNSNIWKLFPKIQHLRYADVSRGIDSGLQYISRNQREELNFVKN